MLSPWATILIGAAIGAGVAGATIDIKNAVEGTMPWERTGDEFLGDLKTVGIGAGTGALGGVASAGFAAAGTSGAAGLTSNVGTVPAEVGAPSTMTAIESGVPVATASTEAINAAQTSFGPAGFLDKLTSVLGEGGKGALTGAAGGAANNPDDPLRGALAGATTGSVSGTLGSALRGVVPVRTMPEMVMPKYTPTTPGSDLASNFTTGYSPSPTLGQSLAARGLSTGSSLLGRGAGMGVSVATAPPPPVPEIPLPDYGSGAFPNYAALYRPPRIAY